MDCPELDDLELFLERSAEDIFSASPVLQFSQHWLASHESAFSPGLVRIGWFGDRFCFDAQLRDELVFTTAKKRNEMLYLLGDTLELFAGIEGDPSYLEYHYAPNDMILQLRWPGPRAEIDLESIGGAAAFRILDDVSCHAVGLTPSGWRVRGQVRLPLEGEAAGSLSGVGLDLNFGRYDYRGLDSKPVLSATSQLPRPSFHDRQNWLRVVCKPA